MINSNPPTNTKFIFITGGVLSGLGKDERFLNITAKFYKK